MDSLRIDKWLWASRFFRTRNLAQEALGKNNVRVNGQRCKASREIRVNDKLTIKKGIYTYDVIVRELNDKRTAAKIAVNLYTETEESIAKRQETAEMHKSARLAQPVATEKPNKKIRRQLAQMKHYPFEDNF